MSDGSSSLQRFGDVFSTELAEPPSSYSHPRL